MLALSSRDEVSVVSDQYGSPTYALHLAEAIVKLIRTSAYGTYHIAGSGGASRFELTRKYYQLLDIKTPLRPVKAAEFPRVAKRPAYSVLTSIQDPLIALPPWEESLADYVRHTGR
jgi:dTDP-4-dehydrorhamnose reductase